MIITLENKFCYVPACYKSELSFSSCSVIGNVFVKIIPSIHPSSNFLRALIKNQGLKPRYYNFLKQMSLL